MQAGSDSMGAPPSFTARRPNASNLPNFELPPPQLTGVYQKYMPFTQVSSAQASAQPLISVGNLLTPPSNTSVDGVSPSSSGVTTSSSGSNQAIPPFTPTGYAFPPPGSAPYGFHAGTTPQPFNPPRGIFSPSLNNHIRGNNSPTATDGLPPPPYEFPPYPQSSMSMSAPASLPALQAQHMSQQQMIGNAMMGGQQTPVSASVTHPSPVHSQEAFARGPPTPSYYSQPSSTPQQATFPYSSGPSPIHASPVRAGGPNSMSRMSPAQSHGPVPSLSSQSPHPSQQQHQQPQQYPQRQYTYPMSHGPVLSNVNNPNGQLSLVHGGPMPPGMMPGFNSGHAAQIQHLYGHHQPPHTAPQNDRPFRCDQCPQSFNRNHDLKRHKRIHLAVKPFPCGHCDKSFSRKDALKRHVLVKGCGKAQATAEVKEIDGSISPVSKSESTSQSPVVAASV